MKPKEGLTAVQRKMLDEIYMEQFEKKADEILHPRKVEFEKLKNEVIDFEYSKGPLKEMIKALEKGYELMEQHKTYFKDNNITLDNYAHKPKLKFGYGYVSHPKLVAHEKKTREIEMDLATKKKEIRARIYGMSTSYDEVEKEISQFLSDIK